MRLTQDLNSGRAGVATEDVVARIQDVALPLRGKADIDPLIERIEDARYVLLGEASHGTSEYYVWRAHISRRLIEEKGFSFIAVEGDWPDCYRVNRYVKGYRDSGEAAREVLRAYDRWPTWMWANWEIVALAEWMRKHNAGLPDDRRVGFYGLDVYSLWESMDAVLRYLQKVDGEALKAAQRAFECFEPYQESAEDYARATAGYIPKTCEREVVAMLGALRTELPRVTSEDREAAFVAEQNGYVVKDAEHYYRTMIRGGSASWNVRDHHMVDTLDRLMRYHEQTWGPESKAIIWEHNTHVGDARATDMARAGMVNVGQLMREIHSPEGVYVVGFGSHHGSVIAGRSWGAPMERMRVPDARPDTWEDALHRAGAEDKLLLMEGEQRGPFTMTRGHRAIGVVYDPEYERWGNYVPTSMPLRYDAFVYVDGSRALHPLHLLPHHTAEPPETYPWGV
jgi:erythromycin esterase